MRLDNNIKFKDEINNSYKQVIDILFYKVIGQKKLKGQKLIQ